MTYLLTRFGDVIHLSTSRLADPDAAGIERFVGLEHIEPENLHIRSWGNVADGTSFTSHFKPGQVLFGKRRAYQRKVAMAEFEGVCSSDIYIFESKNPDILSPELLPFICQSEGFYQYALKTSAGSLSPRTNWSHLGNYEFPLPPLDEQRRIADLLWVADDVVTEYTNVRVKIEQLKAIWVPYLLTGGNNVSVLQTSDAGLPKNWKIVKLGELCNFTTGKLDANFANENGKYPFFTCDRETLQIDRFSFDCEAILLAGNNASGDFPVKYYKGKFDAYQRTYIITVQDISKISYPFLKLSIENSLLTLKRYSIGSLTKYLTLGILQKLKINLPPISEQEQIIKKTTELETAWERIYEHLANSQSLKKYLLESFVG